MSLALSLSRAFRWEKVSGREVSSFLEMSMEVSWSQVGANASWVMSGGRKRYCMNLTLSCMRFYNPCSNL